jgi:hypothetical protein
MGFFDEVDRRSIASQEGNTWEPPVHEFPRIAASTVLLAQTNEAAVLIAAIWAFRQGFGLWIQAPFRHPDPSRRESITRSGRDSLHVGLQFADGRRAANVGTSPGPAGPELAGVIMALHSFGGGPRYWDLSYWVSPLPPPGLLTFFCEWAYCGIPETSSSIEAQLILDAAPRSMQIWPDGYGQLPIKQAGSRASRLSC